MAYGLGQAAEGIKNSSFELLLLFYFTQVLGLGASLAGIALAVALVFDAITDPLAGSWSDNLKHRWGRRHPFMYASAVPLGVSFAALFMPPAGLGQAGLFAWLLCGAVTVRAAMTLYHVPHLALGAELTDDYQERTGVVGYRIIFSVLGFVSVYVLSFRVFFRSTEEFPNGQLDPSAYPPFGLAYGVAMFVVILLSGLGTHSRIPHLPGPPEHREPFSAARLKGEVVAALQNRSFRFLFLGIVVFFVSRGVQQALLLHMLTYFWDVKPAPVLAALILSFALGVPFWTLMSRRLDKKPTLVIGIVWFSLLNLAPVAAALLGFWPEKGAPGYVGLLMLLSGLAAFGGAAGFVSAGSMMADVADEHELGSGKRQEGIFFGALSFAGKSASGLGHLIAGVALDLIAFPARASVADVPESATRALAVVYGPGLVLFMFASVPLLWQYRLDRTRHAEILRLLAENRRAAPKA